MPADLRQITIDAVLEHLVIIKAIGASHGLEPHVLAGLVAQESQGQTMAMRYEPGWRWCITGDRMRAAMPAICSSDTEIMGQKHSWGLCQVMGAVARELDLKGWLGQLLEPEVGLEYGARKLAACLKAECGDLRRALQRYNTGSGEIKITPGKAPYCDKVLAWAEAFKPKERSNA